MVLTDRTVAHYLVERRLLTQASLLEPIRIKAGSGRNRNFSVTRVGHDGFFIKQIKYWEPNARWTLGREADWYAMVAEIDECTALRPVVPRFHAYDDGRAVLVIELVQAESLLTTPPEDGWLSSVVTAELGRLFATLHSLQPNDWQLEQHRFRFADRYPGALTLEERLTGTNWTPPAEQEIYQTLQRHAEFADHLAALRDDWRATTIIHADFRWNNVLLAEQNRLCLIDWELVDRGDPAWDVGSVLQAWLSSWIRSMPDQDAPARELVQGARYSLASMQPAIAGFWDAYRAARGLTADQAQEFLRRSVRFGAARLLQTALESVQGAPKLTAGALYRLQVALNMLEQPVAAMSDLFGLSA